MLAKVLLQKKTSVLQHNLTSFTSTLTGYYFIQITELFVILIKWLLQVIRVISIISCIDLSKFAEHTTFLDFSGEVLVDLLLKLKIELIFDHISDLR